MSNNIKKVKPSEKYTSGLYRVKNPRKYIGDIDNIICRSSWEYRFCMYCDTTEDIVKWSSEHESLCVDYYNPIDNKMHKYWVDYYVKIKRVDYFEEWMLEVKPQREYHKDKKPILEGNESAKKLATYNRELKIWIINQAKFKAAQDFAKKRGIKFGVVDEDFLFKS
jgi:hypothetical protein